MLAFVFTPQVYFFIRLREYWISSDLGVLAPRNKSFHPWHSYRDSFKSLLQKAIKVRCSLLCTLCDILEGYNWNETYVWRWRKISEDYKERDKTFVFSLEFSILWILLWQVSLASHTRLKHYIFGYFTLKKSAIEFSSQQTHWKCISFLLLLQQSTTSLVR